MRLRAVATSEVIGFHSEAIPVESLEGGFIQAGEQVARDGSVGIAVAAHGEGGRFLDAPFGHGDARRLWNARAEFAGEVHAHARETFEEGVHAEERAAPEAGLPRGLVGECGGGGGIGGIVVVAGDVHAIRARLDDVGVAVARDAAKMAAFPVRAAAQHNRRLAGGSLRDDRQRRAEDAREEAIQLLGREPGGRGRTGRQNDFGRAVDYNRRILRIFRTFRIFRNHRNFRIFRKGRKEGKESKSRQATPEPLCDLCDLCGRKHHSPPNDSVPSGLRWMQKRVE